MHRSAVGLSVGIPFSIEILIFRVNVDDAVGGHGQVFVQHKSDGVTDFDIGGFRIADIDQRTGMISRFHGAGKNGIHIKTDKADADQQDREDHYKNNENRCDSIPDFLYTFIHCPIQSCLWKFTAPL